MQLVLSNNRIIAHGENFLAMGGVVINTETGAKYENATIAECEGCPSDIDKVGYEYHAGVFVPCAPYGKGNNNGFFMEVCETCATPRSSGIPIKHGLRLENLNLDDIHANDLGGAEFHTLWENASPGSTFSGQTITIKGVLFPLCAVEFWVYTKAIASSGRNYCRDIQILPIVDDGYSSAYIPTIFRKIYDYNSRYDGNNYAYIEIYRSVFCSSDEQDNIVITFGNLETSSSAITIDSLQGYYLVPYKIYGVKL